MVTNLQLIDELFLHARKKAFKEPYKCLFKECNANSIKSHLLQKNGVLSSIAVKKHVVTMYYPDFTKVDEDKIEFKKTGINNAMTYPLFCSTHDTDLFSSIEKDKIDYNDYKSQLLFSYRGLCSEIRKKQRNVRIYERLLDSPRMNILSPMHYTAILLQQISGFKQGISDMLRYKRLMENEIGGDKVQNFTFFYYKYPYIGICASAIFSPVDIITSAKATQLEPLNNVLINIIPDKSSIHIVIGYHKKYNDTWIVDYAKSWNDLSALQLQYMLTDLIAARIETWCLSPDVYEKISSKNLKQFKKYWSENVQNLSPSQRINFNLFAEV